MTEHTPDPERIDPRWAASTLGALAAVLLILWWVLYLTAALPGWVAGLLLLGSIAAAVEGYRSARRAGEQR